MSKEIRIHVQIVDAEDHEVLHRIDVYSVDAAIEALGTYERHHLVNGMAV